MSEVMRGELPGATEGETSSTRGAAPAARTYAYFPGCKIAHHLPQYGASVRAVCAAADIGLEDVEFNCCGWPVRHESEEASVYSAVRNFALAAREGLPILTPCKCCFGNLQHARSRLRRDPALAERTAKRLAGDGLTLPAGIGRSAAESGGTKPGGLNAPEADTLAANAGGSVRSDGSDADVEVVHLLTALDRDVGERGLADLVTRPLDGLRVACHYGCHALRPATVTHFDDPLAPTVFERVIAAAGAEPVGWDLRLECCGQPLRGREDAVSEALMRKKLEDAAASGAAAVATACTYCQLQFDVERARLPRGDALHAAPPAVLFTQLLGLAFGLDAEELGLERNRTGFAWPRG